MEALEEKFLSSELISRMAPTPSGFLHLGNLTNFFFIHKIIRQEKGKLWLRIDDCDGTRSRDSYVEHLFESLDFLELDWDSGPRDLTDFKNHFSQNLKRDKYFEKVQSLGDKIYACSCSRSEIGNQPYQGTCRHLNLAFDPGNTSLRLKVEDQQLLSEFGDVILWRKDDGPAYHLASVIDDLEMKVNLIIRGDDLEPSSRFQKYLALQFDSVGFSKVKFYHHPLLRDQNGEKLSKSRGVYSLVDLRAKGMTAAEIKDDLTRLTSDWKL